MKIRILVADDQRLMREGLKTILDLQGDMTVVQLAENGRDAFDKISSALPEERPDVMLMDIRMPVMDGVECTRLIKREYPGIKVIILTTFDDDEFIIEALKNGAAGYLLKDLPAEKLIRAIRDVYEGNSIMQPEVAAKVIAHIAGAAAGGATAGQAEASDPKEGNDVLPACTEELTEREKDILGLVGRGMSNTEISKALYISEGTVKNYISSLYSKLGINDRSKLTLYAIQNGRPKAV